MNIISKNKQAFSLLAALAMLVNVVGSASAQEFQNDSKLPLICNAEGTLCAQHVSAAEEPLANSGAQPISWNPGHYEIDRASANQFRDDPAKVRDYLRSRPVCQPGSQWRGVMARLNWGDVDKGNGVYDTALWDEILDYFKSECRGTEDPPRLYVGLLYWSFNAAAFQRLCVPADLASSAVYWTKNGTGEQRCAAPIWRDAEIRERYYAMMDYLGARYNDEPLFEAFNIKGESATGMDAGVDAQWSSNVQGSLDTVFAFAREAMLRWRAAAPRKMVVMGNNYWGTTNKDLISRRIKLFTDMFDAEGGMAWGAPDVFNNPNNSWPPQPATDYVARAHNWVDSFGDDGGPRIVKYPFLGETQLIQQRCMTSVEDCYDAHHAYPFKFSAHSYTEADMVPSPPVRGYTGYAATHTFWQNSYPNAPHTLLEITEMLNRKGWQVFSEACPSSFTENNLTCVVGEN